MKAFVDRFEGKYCICESEAGEMLKVDMARLPGDIKEGDVLTIENTNITVDKRETEKRRSLMEKIVEDVWK